MAFQQSEDEEDGPEQVTLQEGREEAQKVRKDENESKKRRAAEAKQRRKQQSEKKTNQTKLNDGALEASNTDASKSETLKPRKKKKMHRKTNEEGSDDQFQIPTSASTILDDTIVQFLKTKEMQVRKLEEDASLQAEQKFITEKRKHKEKRQPQAAADVHAWAGAHIVLLNAESSAAPVMEKALEFRRNHFYGTHLKRSAEMLPSR